MRSFFSQIIINITAAHLDIVRIVAAALDSMVFQC